MSCEECWSAAKRRGITYSEMLTRAAVEGLPCADMLSLEGTRLRAGQFWDEERQRDSRAGTADDLKYWTLTDHLLSRSEIDEVWSAT